MELVTLGTPALRDDGDLRPLPPKNLAVLVYLAVADPGGCQRRDTLLAIFWPELDHEHARNALNQAVYQLRRVLGSETLVSRGKEELGVVRERVACDAVSFTERLEVGDREGALELYRGPFLEGFHISGAPDFEQWLDATRARLRSRARRAAMELAKTSAAGGETVAARRWLEMARTIVPTDERVARRLIRLLDREGNRAAAVRVYTALEARLQRELGLAPSPETRELAAEVRDRGSPYEVEDGVEPVAARSSGGDRGRRGEARSPSGRRRSRGFRFLPADVRLRAGIFVVALLAAAALVSAVGPGLGTSGEALERPLSVAVLPCESVGDRSDDTYFAEGFTAELATEISRVPGLRVFSRAATERLAERRDALPAFADSVGVDAVLECSTQQLEGRARITARLVDAREDHSLWAESYDRRISDVFALQSEVARAVAVAMETRFPDGSAGARSDATEPSAEAYELYLKAAALVNRGRRDTAVRLLREAVRADPEFAPAWHKMAVQYAHYAVSLGRGLHWADSGIAAGRRAREVDPSVGGGGLPFNLVAKGRFSAADSVWQAALDEGTVDIGQLNTWAFFEAVRGRCEHSVHITAEAHGMDRWANTRWGDALAWTCLGDDRRARHVIGSMIDVARSMSHSPGPVTLSLASFQELLWGDDEAAAERLEMLREVHPDHFVTRVTAASLALQKGQWEVARRRYEALHAAAPDARHALTGISFRARYGAALVRAGEEARGRELLARAEARALQRLREGSEHPGLAVDLALVHAVRGDADEAVRWLGRAADVGWPWWRLSDRDPTFGPAVRRHAGFEEIHAHLRRREAEMRRRAEAVMERHDPLGEEATSAGG